MTAALLRPLPLPPERLRPSVGLLVLLAHVGLLWVANLYWPLQSVVQSALQSVSQSVTVQIFQKSVDLLVPGTRDNNPFNANPQAISNPSRQRFGRAETKLDLSASQTEASTPLAGTVQTPQMAQAVQATPSRPVPAPPLAPATEIQAKPTIAPPANPVPQAVAVPERSQPATAQAADVQLSEPPPIQLPAATSASPTPPSLPLLSTPSPSPPAPPSPVTAAAPPAPVAQTAPAAVAASPAVNLSTATASNPTSSSPSGVLAASGASGAGTAVPGPGSAVVPALPSAGLGGSLNLNLPPRYIYRPPIAVPRRSLSEMANDQLRRKPRDPFADAVNGAGHIDCLKDTPEGPAQGLLAVGPLLKRVIEEKCKK